MSVRVDQELERPADERDRCANCHGDGVEWVLNGGFPPEPVPCQLCGGSGVRPDEIAVGAESIPLDVVDRQREQDPPDTGEW